jgi:hypothetical protein
MSGLNSSGGEKEGKVKEKKVIKRTITLTSDSKLNILIDNFLERCESTLGRRGVKFSDLVKVAIPKLKDEDLIMICDEQRTAQERLNDSVNALIQESNGKLSKDEIISYIASQNLKKICKEIVGK